MSRGSGRARLVSGAGSILSFNDCFGPVTYHSRLLPPNPFLSAFFSECVRAGDSPPQVGGGLVSVVHPPFERVRLEVKELVMGDLDENGCL